MTDRQMFKLVDANTVPSKDGSCGCGCGGEGKKARAEQAAPEQAPAEQGGCGCGGHGGGHGHGLVVCVRRRVPVRLSIRVPGSARPGTVDV